MRRIGPVGLLLALICLVPSSSFADYRLNPFSGKLDYFERINVSADAPSNPKEGTMYIDSDDDKLYIYYGGSWQELHTLTPAVADVRVVIGGDTRTLIGGDTRTLA